MPEKIYQVKVTIEESNPEIWRRLLIPADIRLPSLHRIIQIAFGWTNSHLHQFIHNDMLYTVRYPYDDVWYEMNNVDYNKKKTCLSDLISKENGTVHRKMSVASQAMQNCLKYLKIRIMRNMKDIGPGWVKISSQGTLI